MSTSDGQPPLTRRQIRDLERAREAGQAITGAVPVVPASTSAPAPRPATPPTGDVPMPTPVPSAAALRDVPPPAPGSVVDPGTGLTRRQMRALRDASQSRDASPVPLQAPAPEPRRPLADALNTVDEIAPAADRPASAPGAPAPASAALRPASAPVPSAVSDVDPSDDDDSSDDVPGPRRTGATGAATPVSSTPTPTPTVFPFALSDEQDRSGQDSPSAPPAPSRPLSSAPRPSGVGPSRDQRDDSSDAAPVVSSGHWSTQSDEPDAESVPGRQLGTSTGQQNALILTDAQVADVTGALNATGEIIITGSIDLPRSLASTGSQARIDNSDMDRILEQGDAEQASSDAEPVRASRAISTHTSTRAVVLAASQPKGNHLPLILGISGGVVGLGIIGLIIGGFATGVLG
ncbi:hypothetical protein IFT79_00690 [Frigoribacterium sp. CFBP 8759]|uniref:hypothetical protein n=1 Tax=Frigoribacterium sp. CFBP 8759 TaxID=2775283 RepID=UPI00177B176F|nr:hypothetical protein [Frigoribacterium sp. CFBP 8759]MBD8484127.1 hypothetical protein [Frigoribacterium sp. CFBP 8759]